MNNKNTELLAPAGDFEKLKTAINYGADAVYLGGERYGLRARAGNFTQRELALAVAYAHKADSKVYVVLNAFLHDEDFEGLEKFVQYLEEIKVDALIISDLGVLKSVSKACSLPVHLSTQASCLNSYSALAWKELGVKRVILGREISIEEAGKIKKQTGLEVEMFIHGSMCMAFSGHCTISNYTQGRDSNRGGCAHSCRFDYSFENKSGKQMTPFMSSKDLNGIRLLEKFIEHGIDSIKVEGRMKSLLYVATISKVYSEALQKFQSGDPSEKDYLRWQEDMNQLAHRDYTSASLESPAGPESVVIREEKKQDQHNFAGMVISTDKNGSMIIQVRSAFHQGDELDLIPFHGPIKKLRVGEIVDLKNRGVIRTKPNTLIKTQDLVAAEAGNILRLSKV